MNKVGIIVGEDADTPFEIINKYKIVTFPFVLDWDEYNGKSNIYKLMRKLPVTSPKTSQPSPLIFKNLFIRNLKKYKFLIVITVSSKFSGTYNSAIQARKMFSEIDQNRIHILDSENSSGAEGLLVLKAIRQINSDLSIDKIFEKLKLETKNLKLIGVFEDPRWLVAGGRMSQVKGVMVKNMIRSGFRPVLTIRDGEIVVAKIHMNAKDRVQALFNHFEGEVQNDKKRISVVITHADCARHAQKLAKMLVKSLPLVKIEYIHEISPVVGSHLGPDTLLLSWTHE